MEEAAFEKRLKGWVRFQQRFSERWSGTNYIGSKVTEVRSLKADIFTIPSLKRVWKVTDWAQLGIRLTRQFEPTSWSF